MADIKIVEHVVQELPSERPLVTGHKYKVQQDNGDLLEYLVDSNGEPKFVRGITDDQQNRIEQITQSLIDKLENSYTKEQIDDIEDALRTLIVSTTAGLPETFPNSGDTLTATDVGQWTILTEGTYNQAGNPPIVVAEGKVVFAQFDGTQFSIQREVEMPHINLADDFGGSVTEGTTQRLVTSLKTQVDDVPNVLSDIIENPTVVEDLFTDANLPVRRYTSDTSFNDYSDGYSQTPTPEGLQVSIPAAGSNLIKHYINTLKNYDDKDVTFIFNVTAKNSATIIGIGHIDLNGDYKGFGYNSVGWVQEINRFTATAIQEGLSVYDVGDVIKITYSKSNNTLEFYLNDQEQAIVSLSEEPLGNILIVQGSFFTYTMKEYKFYDPVGFRILRDVPFEDIEAAKVSSEKALTEIDNLLEASKNLIDKSLITRGYYNSSGVFLQSQNTISAPPIKINPEEGFLSLNKNPIIGIPDRFIFFDGDLSFISSVGYDEPREGVIIPPTAQFVALNIYSVSGGVPDPTDNAIVNDLQLEYGAASTAYTPYGKQINPDYLPTNADTAPKIVIRGQSANSFIVDSLHDNGDYVSHEWIKLNKLPQHDIGWYANNIIHNGRIIIQGSFNWIHIISGFPNEGQHVGHGHGCETDIVSQFYLDGVLFNPEDIIGTTLEGERFSFNIASEIYAADSAETTANWDGSNVVPQLPLIVSTKHYMNGYIADNSRTYNHNKLVIMRDGTSFARCYAGMHLGFRTFFDRVQLHNIENTMNDIQTLTPIAPSTASLTGNAYDTAEGWRGELAWSATSYSDRFGYIFRTKVVPKNDEERAKMNVLFADNTSKCYFQPVEVGIRGIPRDVFNSGHFLEAEVYRQLIL